MLFEGWELVSKLSLGNRPLWHLSSHMAWALHTGVESHEERIWYLLCLHVEKTGESLGRLMISNSTLNTYFSNKLLAFLFKEEKKSADGRPLTLDMAHGPALCSLLPSSPWLQLRVQLREEPALHPG